MPPSANEEPGRDECVEMYRQMVLIRHFEELALTLRGDGRIHGVVHPYSGQEAIAVGVCANLRITDRIVSNHRGHGHCIAKGADIKRMMAGLAARNVADFAAGYGMPGQVVDGNDVVSVYAAAREAIRRARAGEGPTLLECKTWRRHVHAQREVPPPELREFWDARDPIPAFENYLQRRES